MAQQPQSEGRIPRRLRLARPRRQGAHLPARAGGAGLRLSRYPQQQGQDAGGLRRQGEAPAGGQVELARLAPGFDQCGPQRGAARRFRAGPQRPLAVPDPDQQDLRRIEPELGQARRVQAAGLGIEDILPDPEHRPRPGGAQGQGRGEARRSGTIGPGGRIDLMQGGAGDAAPQRLVQRRRPEADALHRCELARQPRQSEALPQGCQGACGGVGHRNMFTLCSCIERLQNAQESSPHALTLACGPLAAVISGPIGSACRWRAARPRPRLESAMSSGLFALLDDVAALAKVAAATLDDAATQATKAGAKAAGIVIDDAAVTPRYAVGFAAERELPIIWKIALGSLKNKLLLLLPAALVLSLVAPWAITPLLMAGGAYLCFEGFEKVYELVVPHAHHDEITGEGGSDLLDAKQLEDQKIAGAIKTDFILSAEIMAITLSTVTASSYWMQAVVLAVVGLGMTALVYGVVALIVKADDAGVALARRGFPPLRLLGLGLVLAMPPFLKLLSAVGTAAMLWVGGGIIIHGLASYGLTGIEHLIHEVATVAGHAWPALSGTLEWLTAAAASAVFGLAVGGLCLVAMRAIVAPGLKAWRSRGAKAAAAEAKRH